MEKFLPVGVEVHDAGDNKDEYDQHDNATIFIGFFHGAAESPRGNKAFYGFFGLQQAQVGAGLFIHFGQVISDRGQFAGAHCQLYCFFFDGPGSRPAFLGGRVIISGNYPLALLTNQHYIKWIFFWYSAYNMRAPTPGTCKFSAH